MFKLILASISIVFCMSVDAGYLSAPLAYHAPVLAAPVVKAALPVATSYQNTVQISAAATPIVVKAAPVVAAPVHYAAPIHYAAPLPYALH